MREEGEGETSAVCKSAIFIQPVFSRIIRWLPKNVHSKDEKVNLQKTTNDTFSAVLGGGGGGAYWKLQSTLHYTTLYQVHYYYAALYILLPYPTLQYPTLPHSALSCPTLHYPSQAQPLPYPTQSDTGTSRHVLTRYEMYRYYVTRMARAHRKVQYPTHPLPDQTLPRHVKLYRVCNPAQYMPRCH